MAFSGTYDIATITNPSSALTDFTLIVDLSNASAGFKSAWDTSLNGKGRAVKGDGVTELACDWIDLDHTAKTGILRVKWSGTLASSGTQQLRIYPPKAANATYGVSDTYGQYNAYDSGWEGYWPDGGILNRLTNVNGTANGGLVSGDSVDGPLGIATSFDRDSQHRVDTDISFTTGSDFYLSCWINASDLSVPSRGLICNKYYQNSAPALKLEQFNATNKVGMSYNNAGDVSSTLDTPTSLSKISVSVDVDTDLTFNVNGSSSVVAISSMITMNDVATFGCGYYYGYGDYVSGKISEVQIHQSLRSDEWESEEYSQTNDNATFWGTWTNVPSGATYTLTAAEGTFSITGQNAGLTINRNVSAEAGNLSITGQNASLTTNRVLVSETGSMSITGQDANLIYGAGYILNAEAGSLGITGQDANLIYGQGFTLTAETGSFSIVGQDAGFNRDYVIDAETGILTITGQSAILVYSGESKEYYKSIQTKADLTTILNSNGDVLTTLTTKGEIA